MNDKLDNLQQILAMTHDDMQKVNQCLKSRLNSEVVLINQISEYIINNGGKRLRPILFLLVTKCLNYQGKEHINLAAVVELIHTATLLHDDVVDESEMRRGKKASHQIWGNSASVLVGDFLYSKSFQMMLAANNMKIATVLADATNRISEGEVQQLINIGNLTITEAEYHQVIENKTAKLFEATCHLAAILSLQDEQQQQRVADYGMNLGAAFQIADDVLDYTADDDLGKNLGDDFNEGKLTLPLIYLLREGSASQRQTISDAIKKPKQANFKQVKQMVQQSDAIDYTLAQAQAKGEAAKKCLQNLPSSPAKQSMLFLCDHAWQRNK